MYLNRLEEEQKKPFLNLCNLIVKQSKLENSNNESARKTGMGIGGMGFYGHLENSNNERLREIVKGIRGIGIHGVGHEITVEKEIPYDVVIGEIKAYCREMEIPYSAASEGTFKRTAFELAETRDCRIIAFALMPIVKITETEELLEEFLKYADMEEEFEEIDNQYYELKDVLNALCFN